MPLTVTIRVHPGAPRTAVRGSRGDALVVRVTAKPVAGKATEAALRAVAKAFGVAPSGVRLVTGAASRDKVVQIDGETARLTATLAALRGPDAAN
jgi:uncharacterized protein YggU (UPF0235/DUF167 family)